MRNNYGHLTRTFLFVILLGTAAPINAQFFYGLHQDYGKNRVQYEEFDWVFYRFERFDVYFYRGNDILAGQVSRLTNRNLQEIEELLDAPLDERVQILVFNNLSDLKQSNVNSNQDEDYNSTGVTRISGRRLFVHFNGDYADLETQLRSGLAEVVLANLIYGSFTESIKNSTLLNLPEWYTEGLISYIGDNWNTNIDTRVRDGFLSGEYNRINSLTGEKARYAGHSFWYYISQIYGEKVLKNIVYMAIVNRNIESGFSYILGKDLEQITKDWQRYYCELFDEAIPNDQLEGEGFIKAKDKYVIPAMEVSPGGGHLVYTRQRFGEYKVFLHNLETDKRKKIHKGGYKIARNVDYSYPLFAWHPNGEILAMITEEDGSVFLSFYNTQTEEFEERKTLFQFDKVLSFTYSSDGKRLLFSAHNEGQSDIFIYTILNTQVERLTDDTYNDLHPTFINNDDRVVFSSNRFTDTLKPGEAYIGRPKETHDLFSMPAAEPEDTTVIWRLTNTSRVDEIRPEEYAHSYISFLSNSSGTSNRHLIRIDSSIASVDTATHYEYNFDEFKLTDYNRNILQHSISADAGIFDLLLRDSKYRIFVNPYVHPDEMDLEEVQQEGDAANVEGSSGQQTEERTSGENLLPLYYPGVNPASFEINIDNYDFDDDLEEEKRPGSTEPENERQPVPLQPTATEALSAKATTDTLELPPKRNYFLSFYQDDFSVGFDNVFTNPQYQKFTGFVSPDMLNFGFNANLKAGVMDLMHDYVVMGAVRTTFQPLAGTSIAPNAEFYFLFADYKDRWDKEYVYSRRSQLMIRSFADYRRIITNEFLPKITYPFSPVASIRATVGYRLDKTIHLTREPSSLVQPSDYQDYVVLRLSYVYDNTRKLGLNLYSGLRYKLFGEYYHNLRKSPSGLYTAGLDLRNYTRIHRNLIWANRFATGVSFGPEKLIYIMGGVDNAFGFRFEPNTPIDRDNNYVFQTLITNMRGSFQNIRNGDKFAVINSELRWPILSYFYRRPIRSDFFKNLQLIGFGDVGTAWNGPSPYSIENAINTRTVPFGNGTIELDSQRDPIVAGMGVGLRTRLFGYFLRFDWAWGIESGFIKPHIFYFSLGTDF